MPEEDAGAADRIRPAGGSAALDAKPIAIRSAEPRDADDLAPLFDAYRTFYGQAPDPQATRTFLAERLTRADAQIFIAVGVVGARERIAGFTTLYETFSLVRIGRQWLLEDLFVRTDVRRSGVAAALIDRAEAFARATGAVGLTLSTHHTNTGAQALYERCGFVRDTEFFVYNRALVEATQAT